MEGGSAKQGEGAEERKQREGLSDCVLRETVK